MINAVQKCEVKKMTNQEAIVWLKETKKNYGEYHEKADEALDIAIKALEQPQSEWKLHWISGHSTYECKRCGHIDRDHYRFCANCGAYMINGDRCEDCDCKVFNEDGTWHCDTYMSRCKFFAKEYEK